MSYNMIDDGKGRGFKASVSSSNRLNVSSKSNPRAYYICRQDGQAYTIGTSYSASSGDYVFYIKNTSTTYSMILSDIIVSAANDAVWEFDVVTGTASGTAATPVNMNVDTANQAEAEVKANGAITGLTATGALHKVPTGANSESEIHFMESLIVPRGSAVAIKYTGTAGAVYVNALFFFEVHSEGVN